MANSKAPMPIGTPAAAAITAPMPALNHGIEGTIEGLREQIIANATMVFSYPANMFPEHRRSKNAVFEVIVISNFDATRQPYQQLYQASLLCGPINQRSQIAVGVGSASVAGALSNLLRLMMAELEGKGSIKKMLDQVSRPYGILDQKFF